MSYVKPYYQEAGITIYHGDCLSLMRDMSGPFDLVLTDPPYGMDYQSAWRTDKAKWKPKIANDKLPFIWWLADAFRLSADVAALICFCDWKREQVFKMAIEAAGFDVQSQVIWDRMSHGMGALESTFAPQHDIAWFASRGDFKFCGDRPKSVVRAMRLPGDQLLHPNEKPVDAIQQLIKPLCRRGGMVLDPFLGSGTTLVAAKAMGLTGVGIELDERYCEIAARRLSQSVLDLRAVPA